MNHDQAATMAAEIARVFRRRLLDEAMRRIRHCVSMLTEAQVWHRPATNCNSIANLLLHLQGNVRQWIVAGLGGAADERDRPAEFAADRSAGQPSGRQLVEQLEATVRAAVEVVERQTPAELLASYPFQQGKFPDTGVGCVLHVLEHFSGHAFQIYDRTKQATGKDLRFYDL